MKKIILLASCFVVFAQVQAQTKVTKSNVIGKWTISAVEMAGLFYYSIDKDSLAIGEMMKSQIPDQSQLATITATMKSQMAMFATMGFVFNADGTAKMGAGSAQEEEATYTVDELNSLITTIDKNKKEDVLKANFQEDKLRITVKQPQGEILMLLKRAK